MTLISSMDQSKKDTVMEYSTVLQYHAQLLSADESFPLYGSTHSPVTHTQKLTA
jgi:hypothetical protein